MAIQNPGSINLSNYAALQNNNLVLIQVLRGFASLLVVLYHITTAVSEILKRDFFFKYFAFGFAGVDIFFVLSGFIITYTSLKSLDGGVNNMFTFLRRRFIRVFPSYWIVITLFLLIQLLLPLFYNTRYSFTVFNILQTYLLFPDHTMVNGVSWTLTYELFFYVIFSFVFILRNKKLALALSVLYALIIIIIFFFGSQLSKTENSWQVLFLFPMNTEFVMGILAAVLFSKLQQKISSSLIIAGSILFLAAGVLYNNNYILVSNAFNRVIFFGIPSFLIIIGIGKYESATKPKVHNWFMQLGEASYSLYLLHLPIGVAAIKIIARFNIKNDLLLHGILICILILICWGSIFFYRIVEKPVIKKISSILR
jgi:exopolysaccharide production protein ExoZ